MQRHDIDHMRQMGRTDTPMQLGLRMPQPSGDVHNIGDLSRETAARVAPGVCTDGCPEHPEAGVIQRGGKARCTVPDCNWYGH